MKHKYILLILAFSILSVSTISLSYAWVNPTLNPPGGGGAIRIAPGGNVGIGTPSPATRLDVAGTVRMTGFQLGTSATPGHVLTASATGVGSWAPVTGLPAGATGQTLRHDGTNWISNPFLTNTGTRIGIGTASPSARLSIVGEGATSATQALNVTNSTGISSFFVRDDGNVGIGTTNPADRLEVVGDIRVETPVGSGDILFTDGTAYGLNRYSGKISLLGSMKGRIVNHNPDFSQGNRGYFVYNNSGGTAVTHSIVTDATSPSNSGRVLRISYSPGPVSPGFGGFFIGITRCTAGAQGGACYIEGNRYVHRIWARIPIGRSIEFFSNLYGTGGSLRWISSQAGTGNWEQYIAIQTIGIGGTFSSTGFWAIIGGTDTAFTWDVASLEFIGVDEPSTTDLAKSLNVGFRQDIVIDTGQLLTTRDAFLAVNSGNVGVGTTVPAERLDVAGNVRANAFFTVSDQVLKKEVKPLQNSLEKILGIRGVSFRLKADNEPSIGVIAQDVEQLFPEMVRTSQVSGEKSVDYGKLVAPLIEAIREQQRQIQDQQTQINELKDEIGKLR